MERFRSRSSSIALSLKSASVAITLAIVFADWATGSVINFSPFYVCAIVLAAGSRSVSWIWLLTLILLVLTFVVLLSDRDFSVTVVTNRCLTAGTLIIVAGLVQFGLRLMDRVETAEEESEQLRDELAHMGRVTLLGELASSIAHELSQPLSSIVMNVGTALRWLSAPPNVDKTRDALKRIDGDAERARAVIVRVRSLLKKVPAQREPLDINEVVRAVVEITKGEFAREEVTVHLELGADLPEVRGDRIQLQQVLLNLLLNGIEAMVSVTDSPRELVVRTDEQEGRKVRVSVKDSGVGFPDGDAEKVFDPFFTTKKVGLGMGLTICRSIVSAHDGAIWASANEGPGATFHFSI
jgi:C4-dicarboxylate-specific signal transduction histidine kinase